MEFVSNKGNSTKLLELKEKVRYVAISYHNMAVEEEFRKRRDKALEWYKQSCDVIKQYLGETEPLLAKF